MRATKEKQKKQIELQHRDLELLRDLFASRLMSLRQITRGYFGDRTEAAKKRVQDLKTAGYLAERPRQKLSDPSILHFTRQAFDTLFACGLLTGFPEFTWDDLKKRAYVSDQTLKHELEVIDVKLALAGGLAQRSSFTVAAFTTWPLLSQFVAAAPPKPGYPRARATIKPDGFLHVIEEIDAAREREHFCYLEVDRGSEKLDTLYAKAYGYRDFFHTGAFAKRHAIPLADAKHQGFRVLLVVKTEERRNNVCARLLQGEPPFRTMVWLSTFAEVCADPLGAVWMCPNDYRQATTGTAFAAEQLTLGKGYRTQAAREALIAERVTKRLLFTPPT